MRFPLHITTDMITHQLKQSVRGQTRYPFVLMLEPLYTCNLACIGCSVERHTGKLADRLPLETCLRAVDDCGAPSVSICGGEPTLYPGAEGAGRRRSSRASGTSTSARTPWCSTTRCSERSRRASA